MAKLAGFLLACTFFFCGGIMASAQPLTKAQLDIIPIAAFTANGDEAKQAQAIERGLNDGLTISEIREIMIQMYAYTGFPRSLTGLSTFMKVLDKRKEAGITDKQGEAPKAIPQSANRHELGTDIQTKLVGRPVAGPLFEFAPGIDDFLKEHLFCDIFARGVLTNQERELATIGALAALPAPSQLTSHLAICKNVGLTPEQMNQYIEVLASEVGSKEADLARPLVDKIFGTN